MTASNKASTFCFTSFKGGVGKTFISLSAARQIQKQTNSPVVFFEFNYLQPSSIVTSISEYSVKNSFLDYYMSNWQMTGKDSIDNIFPPHEGIYYIPFCGIRDSETIQPKFHLSEDDLTTALRHLISLFRQLDATIIVDLPFKLSPLPNFFINNSDMIFYISTSSDTDKYYSERFVSELKMKKISTERVCWISNFANKNPEKDVACSENEFLIPAFDDTKALTDNDSEVFSALCDIIINAPPLLELLSTEENEDFSVEQTLAAYQKQIKTEVVSSLDKQFGISDHELRYKVETKINEAMKKSPPPGQYDNDEHETSIKKSLIDEILGLGPLEDFMRDEEVDEIMVNGPDKIFIEKRGKLRLTHKKFINTDHVRTVIERILIPAGRTVNERNPYVDARLKDGSRVHAIIPPLSLTGPMITIRKFSKIPYSMDDLVYKFKSLTPALAEFLKICVQLKKNIIVSGGASSGKTTMLNVLSSFILPAERVICIEDSAELRLEQVNLGRLEARQQGTEAKNQVTIRDLVKNALRMRPDRIIVGECRGPEAIDMLQAMNTGHDGSLTTLHANTTRDALARLETMVLMAGVDLPLRAIREQIASSVNIIIQANRLADGKRIVAEVAEVTGYEDSIIKTQPIFKFEKKWIDHQGQVVGEIIPTGFMPEFIKLIPENCLNSKYLFSTDLSKTSDEGETAQ